jgi:hypothetical protein
LQSSCDQTIPSWRYFSLDPSNSRRRVRGQRGPQRRPRATSTFLSSGMVKTLRHRLYHPPHDRGRAVIAAGTISVARSCPSSSIQDFLNAATSVLQQKIKQTPRVSHTVHPNNDTCLEATPACTKRPRRGDQVQCQYEFEAKRPLELRTRFCVTSQCGSHTTRPADRAPYCHTATLPRCGHSQATNGLGRPRGNVPPKFSFGFCCCLILA